MTIQELTDEVENVFRGYTQELGIEPDSPWYVLHLEEQLGMLIQSYLKMTGKARKKGKGAKELRDNFEGDVADVFCSILILAKAHNIDIEQVVSKKWLVWNKE